MYLELSKQNKKIRFKSIKNIYATLTEGKAHEIIYLKERNQLNKKLVFNQGYLIHIIQLHSKNLLANYGKVDIKSRILHV